MRVLQVIETPGTGGAESVLVSLATHTSGNVEHYGVTFWESSWTGDRLKSSGVPVFPVPLRRSFDASWVSRFSSLVREHRIDVIHAHEFTATCYAAVAARMARVPLVFTMHGKNYWPHRLYRRMALRFACRTASACVAVSQDLAKYTATTLGWPMDRIKVIPNGVDTDKYKPSSDLRAAARYSLGVAEGVPLLLAIGELSEVKGHVDLIRAVRIVRQDYGLHIRLFIAGEGDQRRRLEEMIREMGVQNEVTLLGYRSDVASLLNAADLFLLSSLSEGMPLVILEAMAVGVPVVSTNVGGVSELVTSNETGWLVKPQNPTEFAEAIRNALDGAQDLKQMSLVCRNKTMERFSIDTTVSKYDDLYRRATSVRTGHHT